MNAGNGNSPDISIRPIAAGDLDQVIALDAAITGIEKTDYWYELFHRYGTRGGDQRHFLVGVRGPQVLGYVIGDVRDWEFGSAPCGWVFGLSVHPDARQTGLGSRLLATICDGFRRAGVRTVRTLLARDNNLILSFFRSQGMMAAPYIPLEMEIE
ncbi:MAG: GNAT family N-acetyltransferase [Betaproteobacteria bacterium]|nr:GNAT family N-acetyltransferase [Betaproteobacteria bacterium]